MTLRRAVLLVPDAREALGNKKYVKAHTLSKKMKISPSLAGQILKAMDEWSKYTHGRSKATWVRGDVL